MKKIFGAILALMMAMLLFACGEKHNNEWVEKNGAKYYYDAEGKMLKNVNKELDGHKYHFDSSGKVTIGFLKENGKKYYYDEEGKLSSGGWVQLEGDYYFIDKDGTALTDWQQDGTDWYYLDKEGVMQKNKWVGTGDDKFYVDENGKMLVNTQKKIDSLDYIFDSNGHSTKIKNIWKAKFYVDDFGEFTNEAYVMNSPEFVGKFSNSATTNSKCEFRFLIDASYAAVKMFEYGSYEVKEIDQDYECSIKLDSGYTVNFSGNNHGDRVTFNSTGRTALINCLKGNEKFKLYIKEKSRYGTPSTYLVEVEPDNFKYVWAQ